MPNSVTVIGASAFENCSALKNISLSENITKIESFAFSECKYLTGNIVLPSNVEIIENHAFFGCESLSSITVPSSVLEIGLSAFRNSPNLVIITIQGSYVDNYAKEENILVEYQ